MRLPPPHGDAADQQRRNDSANFALSVDELRAIADFTTTAAREVLHLFESVRLDDPRPRQAIDAAQVFIDGAPRSRLQRLAAPAAHRAAKQAPSLAAFHAAMAAGDAAASMYLHPLAHPNQVGHILRAPAHAILAWEQAGAHTPGEAATTLQQIADRATSTVSTVLSRYPRMSQQRKPVSTYVAYLDKALRDRQPHEAPPSGAKP